MLTIFAVPKAFEGHVGIIQRNAITSWTKLGPQAEVILVGDDDGTGEVAAQLGVRYEPRVARNERGTPLLDDIFLTAHRLASHAYLAYVNADMILLSDFVPAVVKVARRFDCFLLTGGRRDSELIQLVDYADPRWEESVRQAISTGPQLSGLDYFVFPRGVFREIPQFAVGRPFWDHWMIANAKSRGAMVVDASSAIFAVHQRHDYAHVGGIEAFWTGPERRRNVELAGKRLIEGPIEENLPAMAPFILTPTGLRYARGRRLFFRIRKAFWWPFLRHTVGVRHRMGLSRANLNRLKLRLTSRHTRV